MSLAPGHIIDRYIVEEALGNGDVSSTFRVKHSMHGTQHVLKLLAPELADEDVRERFLSAARSLSRLNKPHLSKITDVVVEPGRAGLIHDLLPGRDLGTFLREEGPMEMGAICTFMVPVLNALHQVHERGIVHRDLKPANIFLQDTPEGIWPVLLDFGIARITERTIRNSGRGKHGPTIGTPGYMSPEQVRSEPDIDRRCDLWAAGVVLYESMVGGKAFAATNDFDTMQEVVSGSWGNAEGRAALPDEVRLPLKRCLAVSRDKRYPTARALRAALELAAKRHRKAEEKAARSYDEEE